MVATRNIVTTFCKKRLLALYGVPSLLLLFLLSILVVVVAVVVAVADDTVGDIMTNCHCISNMHERGKMKRTTAKLKANKQHGSE